MSVFRHVLARAGRLRLAGPIGAFALFAAACGTAAYAPATGAAPGGYGAQAPAAAAAPTTITVKATSTRLGTFLTDSQGKTLYLFEKDPAGVSTCTGACLGVWPAFSATGTITGGPGVTTSKLSTIQRPDGTTEVAYNGHPLYYYVGDSNPGDANGEGLNQFGASWYVVSPNGNKIDNG